MGSHAFTIPGLWVFENYPQRSDNYNVRRRKMNKRDLKTIHNKLTRWLEDLSSNADCNLEGLKGSDEPLPDIVDRASTFTERSLSQNLCDRESLLIEKIKRALGDIADGNYGICNHCGEDITIKRLKASPVARYCINCKTEMESRKRVIEA
jgi:DnaK suppressor protein